MRHVFFLPFAARQVRHFLFLFLVFVVPVLLITGRAIAAPLPSGWTDTGQTTTVSASGSVSLAGFGFPNGIDFTSASLLGFEFSVEGPGYGQYWYMSNPSAGIPGQLVHEIPFTGEPRAGEPSASQVDSCTNGPSMSPAFTCTRTMGPFRRGVRTTSTGGQEYHWFADYNTQITWTISVGTPGSVTRRYTSNPSEVIDVGSQFAALSWSGCVPYQSWPYRQAGCYDAHIQFRGLSVNGNAVATAHLNSSYARSQGPGAIDYNFYYDPGAPVESVCSGSSVNFPGAGAIWSPPPPLEIFSFSGPEPDETFQPGERVFLSVTGRDNDTRTQAGVSTEHADQLTYRWSGQGSFEGATTDPDVFWIAPDAPGTYTVTATVDDLPTPVVPPDTGSRDDAPVTQTFTIRVGNRVWEPEPPLEITGASGGNAKVRPGQSVALAVTARDQDTLRINGVPELHDDQLTYGWSGNGSFDGPTDGANVTWVAPEDPGVYYVTVRVDDLPTPVQPPDTGSRDDDPQDHTFRILVGPKWYVELPLQIAGIAAPDDGVTVATGAAVALQAFEGFDVDRRADADEAIYPYDDLTYTWSADGGSVEDDNTADRVGTWIAPDEPGTYTITLTVDDQNDANKPTDEPGTRDDGAQQFQVTIRVAAPRVWDPGTPVEGADTILVEGSPVVEQPVVVTHGAGLNVGVTAADDQDHWTRSQEEGTEADELVYHWTGSGGRFEGSDTGQAVRWIAPRTPGDYTVTCTIDDVPTPIDVPDTGDRDDAPLVRTFVVRVQGPEQHWTPLPSPIEGGDILYPEVQAGDQLKVALGDVQVFVVDTATDDDHWTRGAESGEEADEVNYAWTCTSGRFIVGYDEDGTPQYADTDTGQSVAWVAPSAVPEGSGGAATVTCRIDDKPTPVMPPDTGNRDDEAITRSMTVGLVAYKLSVSAAKPSLLAGGGDWDMARTFVTAKLETADGTPVAGVRIDFISTYDGNLPAGSIGGSATTDDNGEARVTLTSGAKLGVATVVATATPPEGEPLEAQTVMSFDPPMADVAFGRWDDSTGVWKTPCIAMVRFLGEPVPYRPVQLGVSRVVGYDSLGNPQVMPNPQDYAHVEPSGGSTDSDGHYQAELIWHPPAGANAARYFITVDVVDPSITE